jgi:hypothetical protein
MKYYILKRNNPDLMTAYLCDLPVSKRDVIGNRLIEKEPLLLIEKTIVKDEIGTSEHYTNMWTIGEGLPILWECHTKKKMMWDYTGVVHPLIHKDGKVMTFDQYNDLLAAKK